MRGRPQQPAKATTSKGRAMEMTDRGWYFHVWLSLLISLASSATALTALLTPASATTRVLDAEAGETRPKQVLVETAEPRAILAQAGAWDVIPGCAPAQGGRSGLATRGILG